MYMFRIGKGIHDIVDHLDWNNLRRNEKDMGINSCEDTIFRYNADQNMEPPHDTLL